MRQYQCREIAAFVEVLRFGPASVVLWLPLKALNGPLNDLRHLKLFVRLYLCIFPQKPLTQFVYDLPHWGKR